MEKKKEMGNPLRIPFDEKHRIAIRSERELFTPSKIM